MFPFDDVIMKLLHQCYHFVWWNTINNIDWNLHKMQHFMRRKCVSNYRLLWASYSGASIDDTFGKCDWFWCQLYCYSWHLRCHQWLGIEIISVYCDANSNFVVTGHCHNDNLRRLWYRQSLYHDNSLFSMVWSKLSCVSFSHFFQGFFKILSIFLHRSSFRPTLFTRSTAYHLLVHKCEKCFVTLLL